MTVRGGEESIEDSAPPAEGATEELDSVGWLGRLLRWPVRVVVVAVIVPVQVGGEVLNALLRFTWRQFRRVGRAGRFLAGPARLVGRATVDAVRSVGGGLWRGFCFSVRGFAAFVMGAGRAIGLAGQGLGALRRALVVRSRAVWGASGPTVLRLLKVVHEALIFALALCFVPPIFVGRLVWRLTRRVRPYLARGAWWLLVMLGKGTGLVCRAIVDVLQVLKRPMAGLGRIAAQALATGFRLGRKIGLRLVRLWTVVVWTPLRLAGRGLWGGARWVGRGVRSIWAAGRRMTEPVWRAAREALKAVTNWTRRLTRAPRAWYRREISGPIGAAVRSARRDVRRALTRHRQRDLAARPQDDSPRPEPAPATEAEPRPADTV